jgi:hypothetical protein
VRRGGEGERTGYAGLLDIDEVGLEHTFRRLEAFLADFDRAAVWELVSPSTQSVIQYYLFISNLFLKGDQGRGGRTV